MFVKTDFYSFTHTLGTTHKSMHQYIIKRNVHSETTHNLRHIYTSTTKHTIIYTIVFAKSTDDTL